MLRLGGFEKLARSGGLRPGVGAAAYENNYRTRFDYSTELSLCYVMARPVRRIRPSDSGTPDWLAWPWPTHIPPVECRGPKRVGTPERSAPMRTLPG